MKLVCLATYPDQLTAELWRNALLKEGIPSIIQSDTPQYLGITPLPCRLLVHESTEKEALLLIGYNSLSDV